MNVVVIFQHQYELIICMMNSVYPPDLNLQYFKKSYEHSDLIKWTQYEFFLV